jgi:hypothetical protein
MHRSEFKNAWKFNDKPIPIEENELIGGQMEK